MAWVWGCVLALGAAGPSAAQQTPGAATVAVFQDCQTFGCDFDFFRTEIPWVNWVRDREDADVHLLITSQSTGGGGQRYDLSFLGRGPFEGRDTELTHTTSGDATQDERRRGLSRVIQRGLLPYVEGTAVADRLSVDYRAPEDVEDPAGTGDEEDPWDHWVLNVGLNGFLNGESSTSFSNVSGSLGANRVTEAWSLSLSGSYGRRVSKFELDDRTVESVVKDWSARSYALRGLGDHWSAGAGLKGGSTTFRNQDLFLRFAPAVEFSVFPYHESTRRQLTVTWALGANHWNYQDTTLFGEVAETRFDQSLTAQLDLTQPWGQAFFGGETSHYLHDTGKWRAALGGGFEVRLFKGFRFNLSANYSWVRDQLFLPAGGSTDDEILTRQRQLATNYSYFTSFGVSYRFGSIFNNVVNPRFEEGRFFW